MRLTAHEIKDILEVLRSYSKNSHVFLHGSRIDDDKKGGDIDLFFVVDNSDYEIVSNQSHKITAELSLKLREQKVDLLILSKSNSTTNDFFNNSKKTSLSD